MSVSYQNFGYQKLLTDLVMVRSGSKSLGFFRLPYFITLLLNQENSAFEMYASYQALKIQLKNTTC